MEHGVSYETHTHPLAYTISEVAEAGHVSRKEMAKVVMLMADGRLVMAVIPGNKMVDLE
jgi:Ala-tRNA(Pro) deacylase